MAGHRDPSSVIPASRWRMGWLVRSRFFRDAGRILVASWIWCGLLVCSETLPDVVGDYHAHEKGHPMDLWHGGTGEQDPPPTGPEDHFHCHVVHDFSSAEVDVMVSVRGAALLAGVLAPARCLRMAVPEGPYLEASEPPLI